MVLSEYFSEKIEFSVGKIHSVVGKIPLCQIDKSVIRIDTGKKTQNVKTYSKNPVNRTTYEHYFVVR